MYTTTAQTEVSKARKIILIILTLLFGALLLGAIGIASGHVTLELARPSDDPATVGREVEIKNAQEPLFLSPAAALSNGNPTMFYFYPTDICQMRYCRQPGTVAGQLAEQYGNRVNFVPVAMEAADETGEIIYTNWEPYPVEPFNEWIPEVIHTSENLQQATVVLVNPAGEMVYETDEFFSFEEISPYMEKILAE